MPLFYNGIEVINVERNGEPIDELQYNGVTVWESGDFYVMTKGFFDFFGARTWGYDNIAFFFGDLVPLEFESWTLNQITAGISTPGTGQLPTTTVGVIAGGVDIPDGSAVRVTMNDGINPELVYTLPPNTPTTWQIQGFGTIAQDVYDFLDSTPVNTIIDIKLEYMAP